MSATATMSSNTATGMQAQARTVTNTCPRPSGCSIGSMSFGPINMSPAATVSRLASTSMYRTESKKLERPWESYGWLLLLHQLLEGHAVCPGDLRHRRHVGSSLAGLQGDQSPVGYVGKLCRLLARKTPLLPKNPQLQRDLSRHHIVLLTISEGRSP